MEGRKKRPSHSSELLEHLILGGGVLMLREGYYEWTAFKSLCGTFPFEGSAEHMSLKRELYATGLKALIASPNKAGLGVRH